MTHLSYWEYKTWLSNIDYTIVGSGIVGLNCALALREKYPKAKILLLEKGILPQGASTKNAGFACFGSISEVLNDLKHHTKDEILQLLENRRYGLELLFKTLGKSNIGYKNYGGHELFLNSDIELYEYCLDELDVVNKLLEPIFGKAPFSISSNRYKYQNIQEKYITNIFEAQIDTGKMMMSLLHLAQKKGITVLNSVQVEHFEEKGTGVALHTNQFQFETNKLLIATNGFAMQLLKEPVKPARAQVLITKPIKDLHIKGTFHLNQGYYYFRNVENRILFGGGRNLDFKGEETVVFKETELIQNQLEGFLTSTILPNIPFEIERRWSGIMGLGQQKKPIVKQLSNHVYCGVRLGGMGIAIGSVVGKELAKLLQ